MSVFLGLCFSPRFVFADFFTIEQLYTTAAYIFFSPPDRNFCCRTVMSASCLPVWQPNSMNTSRIDNNLLDETSSRIKRLQSDGVNGTPTPVVQVVPTSLLNDVMKTTQFCSMTSIECVLCPLINVGETRQRLNLRINKHQCNVNDHKKNKFLYKTFNKPDLSICFNGSPD